MIARLRAVHDLPQIKFYEDFHIADRFLGAQFTAESVSRDSNFIPACQVDHLTLFVEGEIFDCGAAGTSPTLETANVGEVLLQCYLKAGGDFVSDLNGEFNIVIHDRKEHSVSLFADHVASYPMYYTESNGCFIFGSEKKLIMALQNTAPEIDPVGLLQLFVHIHNLDDRTYISGLRRLMPGEQLTWTDGRVQRMQRNLLEVVGRPEARAEDLLDEWSQQLEKATALRMTSARRVLMSLSAGLDSRAVSCAIDRERRPVWARTWGSDTSAEVQYARQIANSLGFDHFVEDPADFLHSDGIRAIVWRTEGEIQYRNGISIFSHDKIRERADFIAGGWLGDASSGAHLRPFMFLPMKRERLISNIFRWYSVFSKELLCLALNSRFVNRYYRDIEELFHLSYERYRGCTNVQAHEMWDLFNRQTRMTISSMPVDSHLFGKVRAFFDRSYLRFVMGLPMRARVGQNMYKSLIYRIGQEIRDVPDANTNRKLLPTGGRNLIAYLRSDQHKLLRKFPLTSSLARKIDARIVPAENLGESIRRDRELRALVEGFLASDHCDAAIFNRAGIRQLLAEHYSGAADRSRLISIIATFAVALPYFVYDRASRCPVDAEPLASSSRAA